MRDKEDKRQGVRELRSKRIPYERGVCKAQEMVFHDVTRSVSVSGKVLENTDVDFFHSSNANYSCHIFKLCSRSKEYHVRSMKEDNLAIYSLPTSCFYQADNLGLTISSLPFRINFSQLPLTFHSVPFCPPHFLLFSSFISLPFQEEHGKFFFPSFFMCMLLLFCALHLLVKRLNCCSFPNFCALSPCSVLPYWPWTQAWNSFLDKPQEILTKRHIYILHCFFPL